MSLSIVNFKKIIRKRNEYFINMILVMFSIVIFIMITEFLLFMFTSLEPKNEFDPYIGIYGNYPFFKIKGNIVSTNTKRFPQMFFNSFQLKKSKNTKRIFIFGGSNVFQLSSKKVNGISYLDSLKDQLASKFSKINLEIINCSGKGWGSFFVLKIAKEVLKFQPDIFIVYSGNNDAGWLVFAGNNDLLKIPKILVNIRYYCAKFRVYILLKHFYRYIIDNFIGYYKYNTKNTLSTKKYYDYFYKNIDEFCRISKKNKVKVILSTVPSNSFTPPKVNIKNNRSKFKFYNEYSNILKLSYKLFPFIIENNLNENFKLLDMLNLTKNNSPQKRLKKYSFFQKILELKQIPLKKYFQQVFNLKSKQQFFKLYNNIFKTNEKFSLKEIKELKKLIGLYLKYNKIDNSFAMLNFRIGLCYYALKNYKSADIFLKRSSYLDKLPNKATPQINTIIKQLASKYDIQLIDHENIIKEKSFQNIIGWDYFDDNCHLNSKCKNILINEMKNKIENLK